MREQGSFNRNDRLSTLGAQAIFSPSLLYAAQYLLIFRCTVTQNPINAVMNSIQPNHITGECLDTLSEQQVFATYRLFDTLVSSQIPIPELPDCHESEPSVTVRQVPISQTDLVEFETRYEWRNDEGRLICRCARRGDEYLLSLPMQASFHIAADGIINCIPAPGVGQALLRQLLLNQVLPRYLAHTGELLLHASAVTLPNGNTVAFLGESGYGKSTLASYCHLQGAQIIDDDCILLSSDGQGVCITGGVPTLRLYPDSLRALGHNPTVFTPYADGSNKLQMRLAERATPASGARPLDALFLLCPPPEVPVDGVVSIEPAGGQAAMMSILGSAFNLDPSDMNTLSGTFQRVAQTLGEGLPVYHLHYPREHAALPQVLQALQNYPHA
jgi:hypothetical protein